MRDALSFRRPGPAHRQRAARLTIHAAAGSDQKSVIVIGAGVGGMATAGRLARQGLDVRVLEKNGEVCGSQGLCGAWLVKVAGWMCQLLQQSFLRAGATALCTDPPEVPFRVPPLAGGRQGAVGRPRRALPVRHGALPAAVPGQVSVAVLGLHMVQLKGASSNVQAVAGSPGCCIASGRLQPLGRLHAQQQATHPV